MKQSIIVMIIVAFFSQTAFINAQTRKRNTKPKLEKTLLTGDDGFMYYKVKQGKSVGIEDLEGNTLVPVIYDDVYYWTDSYDGTHFFKTERTPYVGAYSPDGKEIIPMERKYTKVYLHTPFQSMGKETYAKSGFVYFKVERNGGLIGICDASGTEVIAPTRKYSSLIFNRASDGYPNYKPIDIYWIDAGVGGEYKILDINGNDKSELKNPCSGYPDKGFDVETSYNYFSESLYWPFGTSGSITSSSSSSTSKSSSSSSSSSTTSSSSSHSNDETPVSVKYHYTKSGKGQSQNTGQWTDAIAPEECEVEFFDNFITVNGVRNQYVKKSGSWKVYGGQSMGWGGNSTTFYYYVDANKNMKQVCESYSPYGFDTFVYPMSMNGDPTPYNNSSSTTYNNSSSSNNSGNTNTQPSRQFKCAYCNGTGTIEKNDNAPASFGQSKPRQQCPTCGKWYDPNVFVHYHQQCRHCGGTGYAK